MQCNIFGIENVLQENGEMLAGNERLGDALLLPIGPVAKSRDTLETLRRSFGPSALMRSLRDYVRPASEQEAIVIDLGFGPVDQALRYEARILSAAVNENGVASRQENYER